MPLQSESEPLRVFTAYHLARTFGVALIPDFVRALQQTKSADAEGRNAMFALIACGVAAAKPFFDCSD